MAGERNKKGLFPHTVTSVKDIPLPKQLNYETAQKLGWDALDGADFAERARAGGIKWDADKKMAAVPILGKDLEIYPFDRKSLSAGGGQEPQPWEIIITLHYIEKAKGTGPAGKLISYKEIPDGRLYWPNFVKRVNKIIIKAFTSQPEKLLELAHIVDVGAIHESPLPPFPGKCSDVSVRIYALPRVPITIQLWRGDDEFPPEAAVLFDLSITDYLPTEDITVLCQMMAIKLMMAVR